MDPRARPRPWLVFPGGSGGAARLRLFWIPYAGGGPGPFRPWAKAMPEGVELVLAQLPGREARFTEPPLRRVGALADALAEAARPHLDAPYVLGGHSMGALLAFETARRLLASGAPPPRRLLAMGHRAPHLPPTRVALHALPGPALVEELARLGGTPEALLRDPAMMELVLPTLRADLEACETYAHEPGAPLPCGIAAYGGERDPDVPLADVEAWRVHAGGPFVLRAFPGGHFFLHEEAPAVLSALRADLSEALGRP